MCSVTKLKWMAQTLTTCSTHYSSAFLSRSALEITETELNVMAALAIIGLNKVPKNGYRTPAAIGTPRML